MRINRFIAAAIAGIAVAIVPMIASADFFPKDRQTYTCNGSVCQGANHVQFNSFTNNPKVGDERPFLAGSLNGANVADRIKVKDGDSIVVRAYIHNNADPNMIGQDAATAKNVRVRVLVPTVKQADSNLVGFISAANAQPVTINDTMSLYADQPFTLAYVPGSALFQNKPDGTTSRSLKVDDSIVTTGTTIGDMKGCFQYAGYLTLKVTVKMDKPEPPKPVTLKKCDALNVTKVSRTKFNFEAKASVENAVIQKYTFTTKNAAGAVVDTKVVTTSATEAPYSFENAAAGNYTTSVVVTTDKGDADAGNCVKQITIEEEPKTPIYECKAMTVTAPKDRKISVTVTPNAAGGAVLKSISYDFGDGNKMVTDKTTVEHTYVKDGDYTVKTSLVFTVNGKDETVLHPNCIATVSVKTPVTPVVQSAVQTLPSTGAGSVIGIFAGASTLAGAAHYLFSRRRG